MTAKLEPKPEKYRSDSINLLILVCVAAIIGVYLIVTAVLISQDSVFYIERSQQIDSEPVKIIRQHPPGYPFMIFLAHKFTVLFTKNSSVYTWIYSAQSVTLLCRLLVLIPIYFIGKLLVGRRNSFWAVLILLLLPHSADFGSDVLREWPHLLFLMTGFLFLLRAAKDGKWWMFGIVGLCAGLGHMIRPECAQLIVYGVLWLLIRLVFPRCNMSRPRLIYSLLILLISFTVMIVPYTKIRQRVLPVQLKTLISTNQTTMPLNINGYNSNNNDVYLSSFIPGRIAGGIAELAKELTEGMMYFFLLMFLVGAYWRFRKSSKLTNIESFFWPIFVLSNAIMLVLLYCNYEYISTRHCLPLISFLCFYVPTGLQVTANWFAGRSSELSQEINKNSKIWFFVLLLIGVTICIPKLVSPMRIEKKGYRYVSQWLRANTSQEDIIAVPDKRIFFYAEREGFLHESGKLSPETKYIVRILGNGEEGADIGGTIREEFSVWVDERQKKRRFVIYKIM